MSWLTKLFTKINWQDRPSTATPLAARNLNKYDSFCDAVDDELISLNTTKADKTVVNGTIKDLSINEQTGVIKATFVDNSTKQWDLNIEKIPVSFVLSEVGILTMTTSDGTQFTADIGNMIKQYNYTISDTISFTKTYDETEGVYKVSAIVRDGSIKSKHLDPDYLASITASVATAEGYKNDALESAKVAQRWAVGRDDVAGSDTDNARYYYGLAKSNYELADDAKNYAEDQANIAKQYAGQVTVKNWVVAEDEQLEGEVVEKYPLYNTNEGEIDRTPVTFITREHSVIDTDGNRLDSKMASALTNIDSLSSKVSTMFDTDSQNTDNIWKTDLQGIPQWLPLRCCYTLELILLADKWEDYTEPDLPEYAEFVTDRYLIDYVESNMKVNTNGNLALTDVTTNGSIFKQVIQAIGMKPGANLIVGSYAYNFANSKLAQKYLSQSYVIPKTDAVEIYFKKKPTSNMRISIMEVL